MLECLEQAVTLPESGEAFELHGHTCSTMGVQNASRIQDFVKQNTVLGDICEIISMLTVLKLVSCSG